MSLNHPTRRQKTVFGGCRYVNGGWEYEAAGFPGEKCIEWAVRQGLATRIPTKGEAGARMRLTQAGEEFHRKITNPTNARTMYLPTPPR